MIRHVFLTIMLAALILSALMVAGGLMGLVALGFVLLTGGGP